MSARQIKLHNAYWRGVLNGAASIIRLADPVRPAPPLVRRGHGSPASDMLELKRDSDRLISAGR